MLSSHVEESSSSLGDGKLPCRQVRLLSILYCVLTLLVGQQEGHPACIKTEWWGAGVVICLERGAD